MTRRLLGNDSGATAAEFALTLPLLMILVLGMIDVGRWIWTYNRAEQATQVGARMAIVTDYVSSAVAGSYVGACSPALVQGDRIPSSCFSQVSCTGTATTPTCSSGTVNATAFNAIVSRMRFFMPELTAANVTIEYSPSGLGYAGSPTGTDLAPIVTVRLNKPPSPVQFKPLTGFLLVSMNMPQIWTSLTAEDLSGSVSN